jgi:hypothetical protein
MKELSDADFDHLVRCQVFNRVRRTNNAGRLMMSHIVSVMTECFDLYLRREQEADEFIDTDMFMTYLQTIVPCEDWHVYEAAHKEYARPDGYAYHHAMEDSTPVTLIKTDMPDQENYEVPHDPAPEGWTGIDEGEEEIDAERGENGDGDDAFNETFEMVQDEFTDDRGAGHVGVMEVDAVKIVSADGVTPLACIAPLTLPSSADANSFVTVQRLDPDKTHKGHVVVSNNGGPRHVTTLESFHPPPHETAPCHSHQPPPMPPMHWVTGEPDEDEMEAAWENDYEESFY